jgi:isoleucyl-tRNA synthetase
LDVWILSKLQILIQDVTTHLENLDSQLATAQLEQYVDDLSKWYVRRSRRRFWKSEIDADKNAAYATLYTVLVTLVKLFAPFIPFLTEEIYDNLVRSTDPKAPVSVHHDDWPVADQSLVNNEIMSAMDLAVKVCSLGHAARNTAKIKLRQPLSKAVVVTDENTTSTLEKLKELMKNELNVRELNFTSNSQTVVQYKVNPLQTTLGPKLGKLLPKLTAALTTLDQDFLAMKLRNGQSLKINVQGKSITLMPEEVEIVTNPKPGYVLESEGGLLVALYTTMTDELKKEGLARDIVRRIQDQRKKAGLDISDHIEIYYRAGPRLRDVFAAHGGFIASETLASKMIESEIPSDCLIVEYVLEREALRIGIVRSDDSEGKPSEH